MDRDDVVDCLSSLCKLDYDATQSYETAIDRCDDPAVRRNFELFRDDHLRHVDDLEQMIRRYGGEPPKRSRDIKGVFLQAMTALRSRSTHGALKACESGEKQTNKAYGEAVDEPLPEDALDLVSRNYQDEQRHMGYIRQALAGPHAEAA